MKYASAHPSTHQGYFLTFTLFFYSFQPSPTHSLILNITKYLFYLHYTSNRHLNRKTLMYQQFYPPQFSPFSPFSPFNHLLTLDTHSFIRYTVNFTPSRGCILHQKVAKSLVPHRIYRCIDNRSR